MAYLDISRPTVYRLITAEHNVLPAVKVGGAWRFDPADVDTWLAGRRNVGTNVGTLLGESDRCRRHPSHDETNKALDAIVKRSRQARNGS
jgi:excisionase family DNA binding protein